VACRLNGFENKPTQANDGVIMNGERDSFPPLSKIPRAH
jgi:hypothetical protein